MNRCPLCNIPSYSIPPYSSIYGKTIIVPYTSGKSIVVQQPLPIVYVTLSHPSTTGFRLTFHSKDVLETSHDIYVHTKDQAVNSSTPTLVADTLIYQTCSLSVDQNDTSYLYPSFDKYAKLTFSNNNTSEYDIRTPIGHIDFTYASPYTSDTNPYKVTSKTLQIVYLAKYPPSPFDYVADTTGTALNRTVNMSDSNVFYGYGTYRGQISSTWNGGDSHQTLRAITNNLADGDWSHTGDDATYWAHWMSFGFPTAVKLNSYRMYTRYLSKVNDENRRNEDFPTKHRVLASNDDITYTLIKPESDKHAPKRDNNTEAYIEEYIEDLAEPYSYYKVEFENNINNTSGYRAIVLREIQLLADYDYE